MTFPSPPLFPQLTIALRKAPMIAQQSQESDGINFGRLLGKLGLSVVYLVFLVAHIGALQDGFRLSLALLVFFESVMLAMVIVRRDQTDVDFAPMAVSAGLLGSFLVLGFRPSGSEDVLVGQAIQVLGVGMQLGSSFSLGRSFGLIPANRGIKTGGLYRLVRHPFYLSYLVSWIGYIISNPSFRNLGLLLASVLFQVIRIRYEEELLSRSDEYVRYTSRVRWHLIPGVW